MKASRIKGLVSIIIPTYNRTYVLLQAVCSVLKQQYNLWETIIIDDGSDDSILNFVYLLSKKDERIKVLRRQGNIKGPSVCRNQGVKESRGEFLLFLDSDDMLQEFCLKQRVHAMTKHKEVKVGVFLMQTFKEDINEPKNIYNKYVTNPVKSFIRNNNPWALTSGFWRADFFTDNFQFDIDMLYMEDPLLHVELLLRNENQVKTFYTLPADCFYRIAFFDDTKKNFYKNSIHYRIVFLLKVESLLKDKLKIKYKTDIILSINSLLTHFFLSRLNEYPQQLKLFCNWLKFSNIISWPRYKFYMFLFALFKSNSLIIRTFRLKGFFLNISCKLRLI